MKRKRILGWLVRPDGAHEEFRQMGAVYLLFGIVLLGMAVAAQHFGTPEDLTVGVQMAAGAMLGLGIFGLVA